MDDVHHHHPLYASISSQQLSQHSRPLALTQQDLMSHLDRLKFFLATAPSRWSAPDVAPTSHQHPALNRFLLPSGEYVTCVLWSGLYHITGTDIVRALVFRFEAFGRPVRNMKKFEEGVFSDLRNLKPGHDACLEEPKSPFLDLLFKYQCIRTQKKQKVFYWFSVPHDRLFLDALERDLKREKMGFEPTTAITAEPARSFTYDPKRSLYEQFAAAKPAPVESEGSLARAVRQVQAESTPSNISTNASSVSLPELEYASASSSMESAGILGEPPTPPPPRNPLARTPFFNMFALFEGSPTYKQRRKKVPKTRRSPIDGLQDRDRVLPAPQAQHFLDGPGQYGVANAATGFPPSAHVAQLAQQMQHSAPERQSGHREADREHSLAHALDHEEPEPEMDLDGGGSPSSQYVPEGPATPQYYEDDQAYGDAPVQWAHHTAAGASPAYSTNSVPLPSPGYMQGYSYSPTESRSSTDALPAVTSHSLPTISIATSHSYYDVPHQHPLSAPSHRMTFDVTYPSAGTARRPRSVTPSLPMRAPHVRRPSTASEAPSTYDPTHPGWRSHASRGYHPYAPRTASAYSSSGSSPTASSLAVQQEYDPSPFAYMVHAGTETYPAEQAYEGTTYGSSPESPAVERQQYEYPPTTAEYSASNPQPEDGAMYQQMVPAHERYYEQRVV